VFTARYALSPYIKQIHFVFKGLMRTCVAVERAPRSVIYIHTIALIALKFVSIMKWWQSEVGGTAALSLLLGKGRCKDIGYTGEECSGNNNDDECWRACTAVTRYTIRKTTEKGRLKCILCGSERHENFVRETSFLKILLPSVIC
jgi:hypothetical protein